MKSTLWRIVTILLVSILLLALLLYVYTQFVVPYLLFGWEWWEGDETIDVNIENYEQKREDVEFASEFLPTLEELSDFTDISYSYKKTDIMFYTKETIVLFVEYDSGSYENKKDEMLSSYEILQEPYLSADGDYLTPPKDFCYNGYQFFTCINTTEYYRCKSVLFIGYNDQTCRLAYCYFWDSDREIMFSADEYTDESMPNFMNQYFEWNEIND